MPASTVIRAITTISSISVKPAVRRDACRRMNTMSGYQSLYFVPSRAVPPLLV